MATRTQRLLWTALPNGVNENGSRLRLSAMLSPRLITDAGPHETLASFPDFLVWAAVMRAASFEIDFGGTIARAEAASTADDAVYGRLFTEKTTVLSRTFEDRRGTRVIGYPVGAVERDLARTYGELAVQATEELPLLDDMHRRFAALGRGLVGRKPEEIIERIRRGGGRELEATEVGRLSLVDLYNTPLSAPRLHSYQRRGPEDPREDVSWHTHRTVPLPPAESFRHSIDFHRIVTALAQYPVLLRLTGLVVDLEVDRGTLPSGPITAPLSVRVRWQSRPETAAAGITSQDVAPQTMTRLEGSRFEAASGTPADAPTIDGFLKIGRAGYSVAQLDVNGSAIKLRNFAITMFQLPPRPPAEQTPPGAAPLSVDPVGIPADRTGTPALRSGGLTLARDRRAADLEERFSRSGAMEDALTAGATVVLAQEDLLRGHHVEVRDQTAPQWHSLCRRDSRYTFLSDHTSVSSPDNEGMLRLGASAAADGHNADLLKLYEGLFTWSGWSLAAPPIGRAVTTTDAVGDADSLAPEGLPLDVEHRVRPRSLPSLRYGRSYRFRIRVVDLAGNTRAFDAEAGSPPQSETEPLEYLRYEPIEAPTLALVGSGAAVELPQEGEDLATAAIRSLNAIAADNTVVSTQVAHRHIVPPLGSQKQAELHGALDVGGRLDAATYAKLVARDGALATAVHPVTDKEFPTAPAGFALPFLPDPLAAQCVVRIYGRTVPDSVETLTVPWYRGGAAWPDAAAFRVEILEVAPGGAPAVPQLDEAAAVLRVPLAKADHVRVRVAHLLDDDALRLLGVWRWAELRIAATGDAAAGERARVLARSGQHWMLTPWRELELVHAVQKPLVTPAIENLDISRSLGATKAWLAFATPVDSRSTEKLDLAGRWLEPVDDPSEPGPRVRVGGGGGAAELKLRRLEAPGFEPPGRRTWTMRQPVAHEFGDTRYRRIGYRLTATTRFAQFMPPALQDPSRAQDLTVSSPEAIGWVPNSAPPPAPDVVYVIPTFGWSRSGNADGQRSWRDGGGLRVYLRRPWLVTGFMEMLAVVLPRTGEASAQPSMAPFVTQWGADPVWAGSLISGQAPAATRFALAVTEGPIAQDRLDSSIPEREGELPAGPFDLTSLPLPGVLGSPMVDAVPHLVHWDADRRLWYADIVIEPGNAYAPFIKLALARYQPISARGAHLSPVTPTEVVQLLPDRLAVVTRVGPLRYRVGVFGHSPQPRPLPVEFTVERLAAGNTSDMSWESLQGVAVENVPAPQSIVRPVQPPRTPTGQALLAHARGLLAARRFSELVVRPDLIDLLRPPLIRQADIQLPQEREAGERFRLVVTEIEMRGADSEHLQPPPSPERDPRRRIVYLETIELS